MPSRWEAPLGRRDPPRVLLKPTMRRPEGSKARKMDQVRLTHLVRREWRGQGAGGGGGGTAPGPLNVGTPSPEWVPPQVRVWTRPGSWPSAVSGQRPRHLPSTLSLPGVTTFDPAPDKGNLNSGRMNKGIRLLSRLPLTPSSLVPFPT